MDERINILIGSDINYAPYYGVMLTSLFMNNKESKFDVHLLTDDTWTDKETKKYQKLAKKYGSRIFVYKVNDEQMQICPLNPENHIARSTYYRLSAAEILPQNIEKIIYMDGDMIVCGDIEALWDYDMSGIAIAGAIDPSHFDDDTYRRLSFSKQFGYFNAGVEIINLEYWRDNNISSQALSYIVSHQEALPLMDQDVVNTVLANKKAFIPICFNFQTMYLTKYFSKDFSTEFMNEVMHTVSNPIVIHYNGGVKPWQWRYYGLPYRKEWLRAYWHSPWFFAYKIAPIGKYIKHLIKRVIKGGNYLAICQREYISEAHSL